MNDLLFRQLTEALLENHYGISVGDTSLSNAKVADQLIRDGVRPFEAINRHAESCQMQRIDLKGRFGVFEDRPLTLQDERNALAFLPRRAMLLLGDQPTTCPPCGSRSDFDVLAHGRQHHRCLNESCGNEFIAVSR